MAAKKTKYKINVPLLAAVVLFILLVVTVSLNPGIKAKYLSQDSSNDSARVAKWKIDSIDANGVSLDKTIDFNQKITTESGFYFFEIQNASEVSAILDNDSKITIELLHETFIGMNKPGKWDFLGTDNPIDFRVVLYDTSLENVVSKDGSGNIILKDLSSSSITQIPLFTTVDCDRILTYKPGVKPTYYLSFSFAEASVAEAIRSLPIGGKNLTIGLFWDVNSTGGGGGGGTDIESKRYMLYDLVTIKPDSTSDYKIVTDTENYDYNVTDPNGDKKTFYIVEKEVNFADYFIVSAGEPTFTFAGNIAGTEVQVPYSEVIADATKLNELVNRGIPTESSKYSDLVKYIESLEYYQYKAFSTDKDDFIKAQSYMQYGLTINVIFDLKVSQKD